MAGTAWSHRECRETALASKEAKKAERKSKITLAISKMSLARQAFYMEKPDFRVRGEIESHPDSFDPLF